MSFYGFSMTRTSIFRCVYLDRDSPVSPGWRSGTVVYHTIPGKIALSARVTVNGTSFDGIPGVLTVIADPDVLFFKVVSIRMTA
jgi:hypothetical protein